MLKYNNKYIISGDSNCGVLDEKLVTLDPISKVVTSGSTGCALRIQLNYEGALGLSSSNNLKLYTDIDADAGTFTSHGGQPSLRIDSYSVGGNLTPVLHVTDIFVHKSGNIDETVTGDKTFSGQTTFQDRVDFCGPIRSCGRLLTIGSDFGSRITPNNGTIEWYSVSSSGFMTTDDNSRLVLKWNASYGMNETFLVGGENASKWKFNPNSPDDELFKIEYGDGSTAASGDTISWETILNVGLTTFKYRGDTIVTSGNASGVFLRKDQNDQPTQDEAFDLGSSSYKWNNIYAVTFQGTATEALYADLAEKYTIKGTPGIGDVILISEDPEVDCEISNEVASDRVLGVISDKPAFGMNKDLPDGHYVALTGRIKCKVKGPVKKGEPLVSGENGYALGSRQFTSIVPGAIFAKALETIEDDTIKLIEVVKI